MIGCIDDIEMTFLQYEFSGVSLDLLSEKIIRNIVHSEWFSSNMRSKVGLDTALNRK